MSFEPFGDAGLRAEAASLELLLADLALGFTALSATGGVSPAVRRTVSVSAAGPGELAVKFLNELVYLADTAAFLPASAEARVTEAGGTLALSAALAGEENVFEKRGRGLLVKAATYHNLKVEERAGRWRAEIVLDI